MKKVIALLLALAMVLSFVGCSQPAASSSEPASSEAESAPAVEAMTYAEYAAAELDSEVTIATYVQATQSWWNDQISVYSQDKDGAYFMYNMACSEEDAAKLVPGTMILVNGYKGEWAGEVEVMDATFTFVEGADSYIAEAIDVTELLGTDELAEKQNMFVSFTGLTVEASTDAEGNEAAFLYGWDGSGEAGTDSDLYFNASVNGQTYTFVIEYYLCNESTEAYQTVQGLSIGDTIDMEGFLYWYEGPQPHITAVTVK